MILKVLGTVSPHCYQDKNCPGYLVKTNSAKLLLDCGNGITRNIKYPDDLQNLTIIISHLHRDHYADIFSIAYDTYIYHNLGLLPNKVQVYIPLFSNSECYDYNLLTNLGDEQYLEIRTYTQDSIIKIGDTFISFSPNPHSVPSYSIKVKDNNSSLVYSGDTGYLGNTIEKFAIGTNLFICESTFLRNQTKKRDYHLYAHEAAKIARNANVDKLLLTHFWPDIDKSLYLQEATPIFPKTEVAEEGKTLYIKCKS